MAMGHQFSIKLPELLSSNLERYLRSNWREVEEHLGAVKAAAERYEALQYPKHTPAFTYLFFAANYAKSLIALSRLATRSATHLVDLAGGLGASTCGALAALQASGSRIERITLLDSSPEHLKLFERVSLPWIKQEFPNSRIDVIEEDVLAWLRRDEVDADIYLASYVLCEQTARVKSLITEKLERQRRKGASTAVIDTFERTSAYWINGSINRFHTDELRISVPFLARLRASVLPKYSVPPGRDVERQFLERKENAKDGHLPRFRRG